MSENKKFAYIGYRKWVYDILQTLLKSNFKDTLELYTIQETEYPSTEGHKIIDPKNLPVEELKDYDALFFYGWSWMVPKELTDGKPCVCLHPAPLPKYRGGTPIQHQIIAGEDTSAVTLFRMNDEIDAGPIYYQQQFDLSGDLEDVLRRMSTVGADLTLKLLQDFQDNKANPVPQDETQATIYKRRKPGDSALTLEKLEEMTARQLHDTIRSLQDPYPNAYLVGSDGKKVYLTRSKLEEE